MRITVAGAGVSGLTCAVVLAERGHDVTVVASEIGITSSAAAAVWLPYDCGPAESVEAWALLTYGRLLEIARDPASHVTMTELRMLDVAPPSWKFVPVMETPGYLDYLRNRFGGEVRLGEMIRSLDELPGELVVNCTGIGARELADDRELKPRRGQVLIAERTVDTTLVHETSLAYAIPRANDCVLGGTSTESDDLAPSDDDTKHIVAICREHLKIEAKIKGVKVGLRPFRASGIRLEREGRVIHNYGHGGSGFTVSWGCAEAVAAIVDAL
jgi:D-amino-acid oxidase